MTLTPMDWILLLIVGCITLFLLFMSIAIKDLEKIMEIQVRINLNLGREIAELKEKTSRIVEPKVQSEGLPSVIDEGFMVDPRMTRERG